MTSLKSKWIKSVYEFITIESDGVMTADDYYACGVSSALIVVSVILFIQALGNIL